MLDGKLAAARLFPIVFVLLALAACEGSAPEHALAVVRIDGETLKRGELDAYLEVNLAGAGDDAPMSDVVCSRLMDTWIDERLVLAEARNRQLTVSDESLDDLLDDPGYDDGDGDGSEGDLEARRTGLRERLMVQFLQAQVLQDVMMPTVAEAARWVDRQGEDEGKKVELRSLRFDEGDKAQQVHRNLRRNRLTFNEAVVQYSDDISQGAPIVVEWSTLPPEVKQAIEKLRPGWSSVPVEVAGSTYLFYVVSWIRPDPEARIAAARTERYSETRRTVWKEFVAELRRSAEIEILDANLPFAYVPESVE